MQQHESHPLNNADTCLILPSVKSSSNTTNILKFPLSDYTAHKFISLELFSSTVRGEKAVLYQVELPLIANSSSATMTRKHIVLCLQEIK
jgi:hypothetical protein